jgi:hypothetical protein
LLSVITETFCFVHQGGYGGPSVAWWVV